ncbi:hypothetical protein H8S44_12420 [Anaerosacchariphilus sp. NSJ-68]|uniref:Major membrane immunogen, membrane-anchored lipoprotein n=2 Tax=Lachnospiraceae TaxID=186803 RepID=A0A923LEG3_9FIRM|nr:MULTISPECIES: hypothetical protein [Lachnospiraceae]MBC5660572.1 hypothetical protein [Anaerosacchariphilus hominis]MBC5699435.1 hypothetical protein [Roseburia difficilis]
MKKKIIALMGMAVLSCTLVMGCGSKTETPAAETTTEAESSDEVAAETEETAEPEETAGTTLEDGVYTADFNTDSSMFHVNEFYEGKGTLTVENGQMTIHVVMPSTNIVNLYEGLAEDAQKDGAELLQPTVETVDFGDGTEPEEANAFDVPVPALGEEFDLALIGTKGVWYDHKVSVSNPELLQD